MKLLMLNPYFKPEQVSAGHFAEDLRQALADAGHTIELYAPMPTRGVTEEVRREYQKNHKEDVELDGALHIHRFPLFREGRNPIGRAIRYGLMELQLLWFGLRVKNVDVLPVASTPPIHGLTAALVANWKKIPFIFTVQDMFPESLVSTGMTKKGSLLWKIGNWVSDITYRNAAHIIVISDSMKQLLIEKGVPAEKITVSYNWIDTGATIPIPREENPLFDEFGLDRNAFYITYAGNLGNSQNVELLVDCAEKLRENRGKAEELFRPVTADMVKAMKQLMDRVGELGIYTAGKPEDELIYLYGIMAMEHLSKKHNPVEWKEYPVRHDGGRWSYHAHLLSDKKYPVRGLGREQSGNRGSEGTYSHTSYHFSEFSYREMMWSNQVNVCEAILNGTEVADKEAAALAIETGYIKKTDGKFVVSVPAFTKAQYEKFTELAEEAFATVIDTYREAVRDYVACYKKMFPTHLEDDVDRACNYMFLTIFAVDICDAATEQGLLTPPAKESVCDVLVQYKEK